MRLFKQPQFIDFLNKSNSVIFRFINNYCIKNFQIMSDAHRNIEIKIQLKQRESKTIQ
ncbi:hypothetical protein pb186bvf_004530 [Paramecium bursaria]